MQTPRLILPDSQQQRRWVRSSRAIWHDTIALLREFHRPIIVFFLAVIVGGWLYGELMVYAGYDRIPYVDLPYFMVSLMVLEGPTEVPPEWYLVAFWYVQPILGAYIVGRGAVDFVRLFFNRDARRSAWELAVISTYRQHVILIGVGHVGLRVARTLVQMGFEVVAVDAGVSPEADAELRELKVPLVLGDGRIAPTLRDAGIAHARTLVVCTSDDYVNLELTMRARDMNPDIRIVVRMWDDRFATQLKRFLNVEVMSSSDLSAPAFAGAAVGIEIAQTLRIGSQDYSMIKLQVQAGSFMEGKTIDFLQDDEHVDIVLHGQAGEEPDVHPDGATCVQGGDTLVLFAHHAKITDIVARNHRPHSTERAR